MGDEHSATAGAGAGTAARVPPLPEEEWDERTAALLSFVPRDEGGHVPHIFTTLVRHPDLFERFLPFGALLLSGGRLPGRVRELLILRTAHNTRAGYEWSRHVPMARAAGVAAEEVARVATGPDAPGWPPEDAALLRAADELHHDARLSGPVWDALSARYDEAELIEITMLVGQYQMIAFTLNSLGVRPDPGFGDSLDDRPR